MTELTTELLNFFKNHKLDRNIEVFEIFNVLNPNDKIEVLKNLVQWKDERYSVYSILCYSYAQIGEIEKAYDLIDYMYENMSETFFDSTIISIRDRVNDLSFSKPKSIIEQYRKIEILETELEINLDTKNLVDIIKNHLENRL